MMTPTEEVDLRLAEPERGTVVKLRIGYPGSPKVYSYAAIEAGGEWYLTGEDGGKGRTWGVLINWLKNKNADIVSIDRATTWEKL